jgi:hypothetical protein
MTVPSTLTACAHALHEMRLLVLFRTPQCCSSPVALNSAQLSRDDLCRLRCRRCRRRPACAFPPFFFPRSAQMPFLLCAGQEMPFVSLCPGREMYVLRLFLVEAEAAWKRWRHAAQVGL